MQQKMFFKTELKAEPYTFTGIANYGAGFVDSVNDRTMPSAWTRTLREKGNKRKLLRQHDPNDLIGEVTLAADAKGTLRVTEGRLIPGVQRAEEAYILLKAGILDSMSIGYEVVDFRYAADNVRELHDIELWEVSLVTFAANARSLVETVKAADAASLDALGNAFRSLRVAVADDGDRDAAEQLKSLLAGLRRIA